MSAKPSADGREPKILSVSDILDAADLAEEVVEIPEWGGAVRVRALTLEEQLAISKAATVNGEADVERAGLLSLLHSIVEPKFSEEHLVLLGKKNGRAVLRVLKVVQRLSGLSEEVVKQAKATFPAGAR